MSQGASTGPGAGDILSQALLQTGLSAPVKTEPKDTSFDLPDDVLSCDIQTITDNLISNLDSRPTSGHTAGTPVAGSEQLLRGSSFVGGEGSFSSQPLGVMNMPVSSNTANFNSGSNMGMPVRVKMENSPGSSAQANVGNNSLLFDGVDIELEELLSIPMDDLYNPHQAADGYSAPTPINNQASYPISSVPQQQHHQQQQYQHQHNLAYQTPLNQPSASGPMQNNTYDDLNDDFLNSIMDTTFPDSSPTINSGYPSSSNQSMGQLQVSARKPFSTPSPPLNNLTAVSPLVRFNTQGRQQVLASSAQRNFQFQRRGPLPSNKVPFGKLSRSPSGTGSSLLVNATGTAQVRSVCVWGEQ